VAASSSRPALSPFRLRSDNSLPLIQMRAHVRAWKMWSLQSFDTIPRPFMHSVTTSSDLCLAMASRPAPTRTACQPCMAWCSSTWRSRA